MTTFANHLTYPVADHYPSSQFQELSKTVSKKKNSSQRGSRHALRSKSSISPREEIYKSMLREIKNEELGSIDSLVRKASGILRLQEHRDLEKNRKFTISWDIDGRRVINYEDGAGAEKSLLQRQTSMDSCRKSTLWNSFKEPIFGLNEMKQVDLTELSKAHKKKGNGRIGRVDNERIKQKQSITKLFTYGETTELPKDKFSKVWEHYINTGDASKLWDSKEAILADEDNRSCSTASVIISERKSPSFSKKPSSSALVECQTTDRKYGYATNSSTWKATSGTTVNVERKYNSSRSASTKLKQNSQETEEKVDRVQHVCVVNGSVVTFKDFGFENFTNWFGDETMLEANQQRSQPKFHLELDLTEVENKDIKIRLLDGYKLEVEARRRLDGALKSIRLKDILLLPKGQKPEDLLMCRTDAGKLIVEDMTTTSENIQSFIPPKSLKSKSKRKLSVGERKAN